MSLELLIEEKETKRVLLVQPRTTHRGGINFELVSILRLGFPIIAGALRDYNNTPGAHYNYETLTWLEDRAGPLDMRIVEEFKPDAILITGLVNEIPRAYELSHLLREAFPNVTQIGGGPHMSAIPGEALHFGCFDAIGHGQGTRYIGALLDASLRFTGEDRKKAIDKIPFVSRMENGQLTGKGGALLPMGIEQAPSPLPDYSTVFGLTKESPLPAATIQLSDSCPYRCTFCRVWTHNGDFVQLGGASQAARWEQLNAMVEAGIVYKNKLGKTTVFIVDDLAAWGLPKSDNLPPGWDMEKFTAVRAARLQEYFALQKLDFMERFETVAQVRIAHGDDPEMISAMQTGARNVMVYAGIEATDDRSLKMMNKGQRVADFEHQLRHLKESGIRVVGMGIIGLYHHTKESIMAQAQWFMEHTDFSTVNWITHLWGTIDAKASQWSLFANKDGDVMPMIGLDGKVIPVHEGKPVSGRAKVLRPAELPPYAELHTGRWATHKDPNTGRNWGPRESHELVEAYYSAVRPIDKFYEFAARMSGLVKRVGDQLVPISQLTSQKLLEAKYSAPV